jgi:hypothetical protein
MEEIKDSKQRHTVDPDVMTRKMICYVESGKSPKYDIAALGDSKNKMSPSWK